MPVSTLHSEYKEAYPRIELTEAAVEGDVCEYVPRLSGQSQASWEAYVKRAAYFNVTERSLLALVGALFRKPYKITGLVGDVPVTDEAIFDESLMRMGRTILTQGRIGLHVDYDDVLGSPKLVTYEAEDVINWADDFVVIYEPVVEPDKDDPFVMVSVEQWRELRLVDGVYTVRIWRKNGKKFIVIDEVTPTMRGATLDFLPFWFVTPYDNSDELYTPPLYCLADLNVLHFKNSVDLGHGLHFTALPQPYLAGDLMNTNPNAPVTRLAIGTDEIWHLAPQSAVGYLEFSGSGLSAIREHLKALEEQMYQAGSRLLTTKNGVESAEALQLRSGSESATLVTISKALQHGLTQALTIYNQWAGSATVPQVELNKDFTAAVIDPAELKELVAAYTAGAISLDTLLQRLYQGEIVDDVATELALLKNSQPAAPITPVL